MITGGPAEAYEIMRRGQEDGTLSANVFDTQLGGGAAAGAGGSRARSQTPVYGDRGGGNGVRASGRVNANSQSHSQEQMVFERSDLSQMLPPSGQYDSAFGREASKSIDWKYQNREGKMRSVPMEEVLPPEPNGQVYGRVSPEKSREVSDEVQRVGGSSKDGDMEQSVSQRGSGVGELLTYSSLYRVSGGRISSHSTL